MAQSTRFVVRGVRGRVRMNWNMPGIIKTGVEVVHITAGEIIPGRGPHHPLGSSVEQDFMYLLGNANVWVSNVSPHFNDHFEGEPGGVEFYLHVDFDSPIDVAITITVEDNLPFAVHN